MIVNCDFCEKEIKRKPSEATGNNFCSKECNSFFRKNKDKVQKRINKYVKNAWTNMNIRAGKYRHLQTKQKCKSYVNIQIEFNRDEFKNWVTQNKEILFSLERPSIDRLDSNRNYSLDNIQLIELRDNIQKKKYGCRYINGPLHGTLRGVRKVGNKYTASITINGKCITLGTFRTKIEAYEKFHKEYKVIRGFEPFKKELIYGN